jgi:DNA repair protein RadC
MNNLRIADMAENEKPVEKLLMAGTEAISDAELLAIILRTGNDEISAISLAQQILNSHPVYKGLSGLNHRHPKELMEIKGVGKVKAAQILALTEISKRIVSSERKDHVSFDSPVSVADYFMEEVRYLEKERVYALFMTSDNYPFHKIRLSEGSIDRSIMSSRELYKEAVQCNAKSVILLHNHPSGNPEPSDMDIIITKEIQDFGKNVDIPLLDHIIIGDGDYYSFKEHDHL